MHLILIIDTEEFHLGRSQGSQRGAECGVGPLRKEMSGQLLIPLGSRNTRRCCGFMRNITPLARWGLGDRLSRLEKASVRGFYQLR